MALLCHSPCSFQFWKSFLSGNYHLPSWYFQTTEANLTSLSPNFYFYFPKIKIYLTRAIGVFPSPSLCVECSKVVVLILRLILGQYCVELHQGRGLGTQSLHSLTTTRLDKKLGQNSSPKTVPQCNSTQLWPSLTRNLKILRFRNSRENGFKLYAQ